MYISFSWPISTHSHLSGRTPRAAAFPSWPVPWPRRDPPTPDLSAVRTLCIEIKSQLWVYQHLWFIIFHIWFNVYIHCMIYALTLINKGFITSIQHVSSHSFENLHQECCQVAQLGDAAVDGKPGELGSIGQLWHDPNIYCWLVVSIPLKKY